MFSTSALSVTSEADNLRHRRVIVGVLDDGLLHGGFNITSHGGTFHNPRP